jgi:DNA adenine methylase
LQEIVNVASVPQRSPFRYPGGKTWLIPQLRRWLNNMARPRLLIEPFAGGGIMGLTAAFEQLAEKVLLVELDPDVAAVWRAILNGQGERLARRIESFQLTRESACAALGSKAHSIVDRAFATILRNRVQHGGILAPGASLMRKGENGKGIGSRWYAETLAKRIRSIAENRSSISLLQADGFTVIEQYHDDRDVVFFVDPPYVTAGRRLYKYSEVDHHRLFQLMRGVAGEFLITYDDTPEVRAWVDEFDLKCESVAMKSRQHSRKSELLIGRDLQWLQTRPQSLGAPSSLAASR